MHIVITRMANIETSSLFTVNKKSFLAPPKALPEPIVVHTNPCHLFLSETLNQGTSNALQSELGWHVHKMNKQVKRLHTRHGSLALLKKYKTLVPFGFTIVHCSRTSCFTQFKPRVNKAPLHARKGRVTIKLHRGGLLVSRAHVLSRSELRSELRRVEQNFV